VTTLRGGGAHLKSDPKIEIDNNYYFTDYQADFIFNYIMAHMALIKNPHILDVCSGTGVLGKAILKLFEFGGCNFIDIKKCSWLTKKLDCYEGADNFIGQDFLKPLPMASGRKFDIIVVNPPWAPLEIAFKIYQKALTLLSPNGILFFIINNTFTYQGRDRLPLLKFQKYYLLPRNCFNTNVNRKLRKIKILNDRSIPNEKKQAKITQQILLDAGIMVYHNDNKIPNEAALLKPIIQVPTKKESLTLPGF